MIHSPGGRSESCMPASPAPTPGRCHAHTAAATSQSSGGPSASAPGGSPAGTSGRSAKRHSVSTGWAFGRTGAGLRCQGKVPVGSGLWSCCCFQWWRAWPLSSAPAPSLEPRASWIVWPGRGRRTNQWRGKLTNMCSAIGDFRDLNSAIGHLQQPESSGLAWLVVDVLLSVTQQHLQLRLRDFAGLDVLYQNGDGLWENHVKNENPTFLSQVFIIKKHTLKK